MDENITQEIADVVTAPKTKRLARAGLIVVGAVTVVAVIVKVLGSDKTPEMV